MKTQFGEYIRAKREALREKDRSFSLRQVATRIGIEPSYLSKIERCEPVPLSEAKIIALAEVLGEDQDVLLAMAGKVSRELQEVIMKRPLLFSQLIRELKEMPDHAILKLVREIREGDW